MTAFGRVALDGEEVPAPSNSGGRPEPGESWKQTLEREILEKACATVGG